MQTCFQQPVILTLSFGGDTDRGDSEAGIGERNFVVVVYRRRQGSGCCHICRVVDTVLIPGQASVSSFTTIHSLRRKQLECVENKK